MTRSAQLPGLERPEPVELRAGGGVAGGRHERLHRCEDAGFEWDLAGAIDDSSTRERLQTWRDLHFFGVGRTSGKHEDGAHFAHHERQPTEDSMAFGRHGFLVPGVGSLPGAGLVGSSGAHGSVSPAAILAKISPSCWSSSPYRLQLPSRCARSAR